MQAPRFTYLPLILSEIEQIFLPSIIPPDNMAESSRHQADQTEGYRREDFWFEVEWDGVMGKQRDVCKW